MTLPASVRVNVRANFPAIVTATGFITISKANGVWSIGASFKQLAPLPSSLFTATSFIPVQDTVAGVFYSISMVALISAVSTAHRTVTAAVAGVIQALPTDGDILINLGTPAAVAVDLLAAASATRPVGVKDLAGNANTFNITVTPSGSETIDGQTNFVIASDGGAVTLYPLSGVGWYIK